MKAFLRRAALRFALSALAICAASPAPALAAAAIESRAYNADESVRYPYVVLEDEAAAKRVNTLTEGTAHEFVRLVKETKEHSPGADVSASLSYEVAHSDDDILSIVFTEYRYVGRAAHPMVSMRTLNFRADTGRLLAAADLRERRALTPEQVTEKLREKAEREHIPLNPKFGGLSALPETFYFDGDCHVHFLFGQNEIAPAAFGIIDLDADA